MVRRRWILVQISLHEAAALRPWMLVPELLVVLQNASDLLFVKQVCQVSNNHNQTQNKFTNYLHNIQRIIVRPSSTKNELFALCIGVQNSFGSAELNFDLIPDLLLILQNCFATRNASKHANRRTVVIEMQVASLLLFLIYLIFIVWENQFDEKRRMKEMFGFNCLKSVLQLNEEESAIETEQV
ncbi:Hypothetical_protein [Hexamita inflata]|uniref:Hypothetical_protein n=1 Tax=Hexamita inflata TaxID=28002 RepID=A0AA86NXP1_9EUKA|nr:Hypothetical protein HINF_LOCUS14630 [Hexamita inflata]